MRTRYSIISRLSSCKPALTHTRPVVREKNAHSSHATCRATSTTVMVIRLRMRLKNFTIGSRNIRLPPFALHYNIRQYSAVCAVLQVMQKKPAGKAFAGGAGWHGLRGAVAYSAVLRRSRLMGGSSGVGMVYFSMA